MSTEAPNQFDQLVEIYAGKLQAGIKNDSLEIKPSLIPNAGLGVFARVDFNVEDAIEFCHCIVLDWRRKYHQDLRIQQYAYSPACQCEECKKHGTNVVLPLGYGMIYNSAESMDASNCKFHIIPNKYLMVFSAKKPIQAGQEILTWWGEGYYKKWCQPLHEKTEKQGTKNEENKKE